MTKDFYHRVYEIVRLIPEGRVTTYGHIARSLGSGRSSRLVGWAMNQSHVADPGIPAHRVVNRNGHLTGKMHFSSLDEMSRLLEKEGHIIERNRIVGFENVLWDPMSIADDL